MREVGAIGKDSKNESQNFKYRGAEAVYNRVQPLFAKHGIFSVPTVLETTREAGTTAKGTVMHWTILKVQYEFFADDGSSVTVVVSGEGMDSGDKSCAKAMTICHRYAICQLLNIPFAVVDPDANTPEWFSTKPKSVTLDDVNKLKVAWYEANKGSLDGKDKTGIKLAFSLWVNETSGEQVKADDFRDWSPECLEKCREALR